MTFAQIAGRSSLRDIVVQFRAQSSNLYHLGIKAVKRSTLADANNDQPAAFFQALFEHQYAKCAAVAPKKKFRFKNKLYSLDATVIDLCLSMFPRAKFRRAKGGIKMHTAIDRDGYIPTFVRVTDAKTPDLVAARLLKLLRRGGLHRYNG
jgi:hypothetical protein